MTQSQNQQRQLPTRRRSTNFNGGAIIDPDGREIPITESMLQKAFNDLISAWEHAHQRRTSN
ncbi:MAG: hypothetical protein PVG89_14520 [Gammaproteobacteria bacterium]|jgi:hypothetical protein